MVAEFFCTFGMANGLVYLEMDSQLIANYQNAKIHTQFLQILVNLIQVSQKWSTHAQYCEKLVEGSIGSPQYSS